MENNGRCVDKINKPRGKQTGDRKHLIKEQRIPRWFATICRQEEKSVLKMKTIRKIKARHKDQITED